MRDTIDLLEAIGQDASLRYAPPKDLANVLKQVQASAALAAAVALGDSSQLSAEFGPKPMNIPHITQSPGREGDDPEDDDVEEPSDILSRGPASSPSM